MIREQKLRETKSELSKRIREIDKELEEIKIEPNGIPIVLDKIFDKIKELKSQGLNPKCIIASTAVMNYIFHQQFPNFYDLPKQYRNYFFIKSSSVEAWDEFYIGV